MTLKKKQQKKQNPTKNHVATIRQQEVAPVTLSHLIKNGHNQRHLVALETEWQCLVGVEEK